MVEEEPEEVRHFYSAVEFLKDPEDIYWILEHLNEILMKSGFSFLLRD